MEKDLHFIFNIFSADLLTKRMREWESCPISKNLWQYHRAKGWVGKSSRVKSASDSLQNRRLSVGRAQSVTTNAKREFFCRPRSRASGSRSHGRTVTQRSSACYVVQASLRRLGQTNRTVLVTHACKVWSRDGILSHSQTTRLVITGSHELGQNIPLYCKTVTQCF